MLPRLSYVPLLAALVLSALLVTLGSGPAGSDARVNLFGVQPVDAIRLLVTLFLAGYFARRWELLRELRDAVAQGRWAGLLHVPRRQEAVPVLGGILVVLFGFFLQKDLGPALMVACVFLGMYGVARGRWVGAVGGLALLAGGFVLGHYLRISSTLVARVQIWRSPWDNGARGGDQVAQALWALASGGWTGTGLGHGMPEVVPAAHTDLVLTAAGEQLGFAGLFAIALLFAAVCASGFRTAARARGEYSVAARRRPDGRPRRAGAADCRRLARTRPADRRRHAVPQLRPLGAGRELRRRRAAAVDRGPRTAPRRPRLRSRQASGACSGWSPGWRS